MLAAAAVLSGWLRASVLSVSVLAVVAGLFLAGVDVVSVDSRSEVVKHSIELALIITLFSDGLLVERELLARHWGPAARALIIAMPVTMALLAVCAKLVFPGAGMGGVLLARRPAVPDRPGAHVHSRHQPASAAGDPAFAQPRVGPQRRPRAAGGARVHGGGRVA